MYVFYNEMSKLISLLLTYSVHVYVTLEIH